MSTGRSALPFLGAVGVALTTLSVGYYTYKYARNHHTQLRPRARAPSPSGDTTQSPTPENSVPPNLPTESPIQNNVYMEPLTMNFAPTYSPIQPDNAPLQPSSMNFAPAQWHYMPQQFAPPAPAYEYRNNPQPGTQNFITRAGWQPVLLNHPSFQGPNHDLPHEDEGPPMSLRSYEALSPEDRPRPPVQMSNPDDYLGEELSRQLLRHRDFSARRLVKKSCQVRVDQRNRTIHMDIGRPLPTTDLERAYRLCFEYLNNPSRDATIVVATVGQQHASSLLSLIRLRKMLERLAADDTNHRCKSLLVDLPDMGSTSNHSNEPYPGLLPLTTTLHELEILHWKGFRNQLHLIGADALSNLTNLTLESEISFQDTIYLLECVSGTLRQCSIKKVDDGRVHVLAQPNVNQVILLRLQSLTIHAICSPNFFLNRLRFRDELNQLHLEVHNDLVNPADLETVPWRVIDDIQLICNFVAGGAQWVRNNARQDARLVLRSPNSDTLL